MIWPWLNPREREELEAAAAAYAEAAQRFWEMREAEQRVWTVDELPERKP